MAYTPPLIISKIPADDTTSDATPIRALPQSVDRISFAKAVSGGIDTDWGAIVGSIGSGMAVNQTGGNLVVTTGTTARSETIIRSAKEYEGGIRLRARSALSQRIVNQNFFVELVDVVGDGLAYAISSATVMVVTFTGSHGFTSANVGQSMYLGGFSGTGTFLSGRYVIASVSGNDITFTVSGFAVGTGTCSAFGWNYYQLQYQGTTATAVNYDTQRKGYATGATAATINTTASQGHLAIVTGNDMVSTFADQLVATGTTIKQTIRATRDENVPDDATLRLQIRIANGSTAPASTTTWTLGMVAVSNYANQDVSIQDVRPMGVENGLPVEILRTVSTAVTGTVTATIAAGASTIAKAEDAAHASGNVGIMSLGVRYESLTAPCAANDYGFVQVDDLGKTVTMPYAPTVNHIQGTTAAITNTSDTAVITAGAAGVRNYITSITVANSSAVASVVELKDGSTVIWRGYAPATNQISINFPTPLKGTYATAINVAMLTTATNTYVTCTGFRAL